MEIDYEKMSPRQFMASLEKMGACYLARERLCRKTVKQCMAYCKRFEKDYLGWFAAHAPGLSVKTMEKLINMTDRSGLWYGHAAACSPCLSVKAREAWIEKSGDRVHWYFQAANYPSPGISKSRRDKWAAKARKGAWAYVARRRND